MDWVICFVMLLSLSSSDAGRDDYSDVVGGCQWVETSIGVITCSHCELSTFNVRSYDLDFAIIGEASDGASEVSFGVPSYFFCRRGTRYALATVSSERHQWIVETEFYPGESGSGVYDSDGNVCGIVLGNVRERGGRWKGRVLKMRSVVDALKKAELRRNRWLKRIVDRIRD